MYMYVSIFVSSHLAHLRSCRTSQLGTSNQVYSRSNSCYESDYIYRGHFLNREEVAEIKLSWNMVIGDDTGSHGINILIRWQVKVICKLF